MFVEKGPIDGVLVLRPTKFGDARGFFSETFRQSALVDAGLDVQWVQDNHSFSAAKGVLRGLHFQKPPKAQGKLVRVVQGAIFDVMVDVRKSSPTYGQYFCIELSRENWTQAYIPPGFAHGFCTTEENTEVIYKVTSDYSPQDEGGLAWDDPQLAIPWPATRDNVTLSERDKKWPSLSELVSPFA
jgi:dTDP-4-dehydrorhamnose 3,5-epimerase